MTIEELEKLGVVFEYQRNGYVTEYVTITYKDKFAAGFNDEAHIDCPEDLIWSRDISPLFLSGVELGLLLAKEKNNADMGSS